MIIVIGEALIDLIQDRNNKDEYKAVVGGANANVAIALARRGTPHTFLARLSTDSFGQQIKDKLQKNNVNIQNAITTNEPTTLAVVSIQPSGSASYSFYVNGTADWGWTPEELPNLKADAIQFGCLTMAMEPGNLVIEEWAKAQSNEKTISHDINMRPALGFDQAKELTRVERVNSFSHIIKASDEDLEWLDPSRTPEETATKWSINKLVLITKGADGVDVYKNGQMLFNVPSRKIKVVDTVGAGDTFTANLLAQLQENNHLGENPTDKLMNIPKDDLKEFVRVAGIAASITCERAGAEPPTEADLEDALTLEL
jgi:fructokinase